MNSILVYERERERLEAVMRLSFCDWIFPAILAAFNLTFGIMGMVYGYQATSNGTFWMGLGQILLSLVGTVILTIFFLPDLSIKLSGYQPSYVRSEAKQNEKLKEILWQIEQLQPAEIIEGWSFLLLGVVLFSHLDTPNTQIASIFIVLAFLSLVPLFLFRNLETHFKLHEQLDPNFKSKYGTSFWSWACCCCQRKTK